MDVINNMGKKNGFLLNLILVVGSGAFLLIYRTYFYYRFFNLYLDIIYYYFALPLFYCSIGSFLTTVLLTISKLSVITQVQKIIGLVAIAGIICYIFFLVLNMVCYGFFPLMIRPVVIKSVFSLLGVAISVAFRREV